MHITKYGHSCLFIEENQARILIDPGSYVFKDAPLKPEDLPECNVLLLTHPHPDHTDPEAIKKMYEAGIMSYESGLILTNEEVKKVLKQNGIESEVLKPGEERVITGGKASGAPEALPPNIGVTIRAVACDHGHIADHFPRVENIGFLISSHLRPPPSGGAPPLGGGTTLFHPGDCVAPSEEVQAEILAVPVVAPWMAVREALEFIKKVKPKFAIPIHDAIARWPETPWYKIVETGLQGSGIEFTPLKIGEAREF